MPPIDFPWTFMVLKLEIESLTRNNQTYSGRTRSKNRFGFQYWKYSIAIELTSNPVVRFALPNIIVILIMINITCARNGIKKLYSLLVVSGLNANWPNIRRRIFEFFNRKWQNIAKLGFARFLFACCENSGHADLFADLRRFKVEYPRVESLRVYKFAHSYLRTHLLAYLGKSLLGIPWKFGGMKTRT